MRKALFILAAALALAGCKGPQEPKVMARPVPERADDFIWENDYVIYRAYGKTLEDSIDFLTSPGFDIWVKHPGKLVADQLYKDELENGLSYHNDRGLGKDAVICAGNQLCAEQRNRRVVDAHEAFHRLVKGSLRLGRELAGVVQRPAADGRRFFLFLPARGEREKHHRKQYHCDPFFHVYFLLICQNLFFVSEPPENAPYVCF